MANLFNQMCGTVPLFPEAVLLGGTLLLLLFGVFAENRSAAAVSYAGVVLLAITGLLISFCPPETRQFFGGAVIDDDFGRFAKLLTLCGSGFALVLSFDFLRRHGIFKFEFAILALLSTVGMMLMISANDLISMYLALELQSLALYVLAAFDRDNVRSSEAGLKYFVLGALSSGMLLYGCSLVYGFTGTTQFVQIAAVAKAHPQSVALIFGLVFILAGLAFKVSAVPFHMWTPDVYEGAPAPVTAFFAAAPKMAAMALLTRVVLGAFPSVLHDWQQIIIAVSIASMALGAFAAIGQTNIKRLMAYSSIGHVGFVFVGLAAGTVEGVQGVLIYLSVYLAMTLGTFACIVAMRRDGDQVEDISSLSGLSRTQPLTALMLALLMFSLAGIPPLGGFFAKFYVFLAAINAGLYWLAVIGVVTSVIGAYYYLRIIKVMYFDEAPKDVFDPMAGSVKLVFAAGSLIVLLFFAIAGPLAGEAHDAAKSLFPKVEKTAQAGKPQF
jgi:NADH-quinone oxidoreductase subunit N